MSTTTSRRRVAFLAAGAAVFGAAVLSAPLSHAAAPAPIPSDLPRADCVSLQDAKGDSTESGSDIKALVMRSTPTQLIGYIEMYQLGTSGDGLLDEGNHFAWGITLNNHEVVAQADQSGAVSGLVRGVLGQADVTGRIDGADTPALNPQAKFDFKSNTVIISLDRAAIEKATGGSLATDTQLLGLNAEAGPMLIVGLDETADTVSDSPTFPTGFKMDHNLCFGPAPATVEITGDHSTSVNSTAHLAARLVNADGSLTAGRHVTFQIGDFVTEGITDSTGQATGTMNLPYGTGFYTLTIHFAGDDLAGETTSTSQFVINYRATHLTMSYVDRPNGRLFTVHLLDSNNQGIGNRSITWSVKGTNKATTKTGSDGSTSYLDPTISREVKATYAGISNQEAGCSAEFKY